jgi:hypothetical protein
MRQRLRAIALLALLAAVVVAIGGCGVSDPYTESTQEEEAAARPADREPMKEPAPDPDPGAPPKEVIPATPQGTLRYAASLAGNWKGAGATRAYSKLAALSTGSARAEFTKLAAQSELDVQAAVGYASTRASVAAVSVKGKGGFREAVVVTKQQIASAELTHLPAEYKVTLATVTRWGKGWAISSWEPQP